MASSRSKLLVVGVVAALAITSAIEPAMAQRGGHGFRHGGGAGFHHGGGGFKGGGFHAGRGFQGGGFHNGPRFAGGGFNHGWRQGGFAHQRHYGNPNWSYARGGYYSPGYYNGGYYGGYGYGGFGLGLTAGLIGGALAATAASDGVYDSGRSVEYCKARFKSYNVATGTYLGYDGLRHRCP